MKVRRPPLRPARRRWPPRPHRRPRPSAGGETYLIQAVGTGLIKIGHGRSAHRRLKALSTGTPYPLQLLRKIPSEDSYALEQALHARYAAFQRHNEWYALPATILAALLQEVF